MYYSDHKIITGFIFKTLIHGSLQAVWSGNRTERRASSSFHIANCVFSLIARQCGSLTLRPVVPWAEANGPRAALSTNTGTSLPAPLAKGLSGLTPRTCVHFLHYSPQMFWTLEPTAEPDSGPTWISLPGSVAEDGLCLSTHTQARGDPLEGSDRVGRCRL